MAAICKIAVISVVTLAVIWIVMDNVTYKRVIKYPTIQRRILEGAQPYIYGLKCEIENDFDDDSGIMKWVGSLPFKAWTFITGSPHNNQLYACELDWKLASFQFSVKANGEGFWMPFDIDLMVVLWVMLASAAVLSFPPLVYYLAGYYPEYMGYEELDLRKPKACADIKKVSDSSIQQAKSLGIKSDEECKALMAK